MSISARRCGEPLLHMRDDDTHGTMRGIIADIRRSRRHDLKLLILLKGRDGDCAIGGIWHFGIADARPYYIPAMILTIPITIYQ